MEKIVKLVVGLLPSIICFIAVQYFYDIGIVEPLTLVAMVFIFLAALALGIYVYIKIKIEAFWHGITLVMFLSTIVFLVNNSVPLRSNEFVSISEKLEYRKDVKNNDLFIFKFSDKQIAQSIKRYNDQIKMTYVTKDR
jgi:hypothetical protein